MIAILQIGFGLAALIFAFIARAYDPTIPGVPTPAGFAIFGVGMIFAGAMRFYRTFVRPVIQIGTVARDALANVITAVDDAEESSIDVDAAFARHMEQRESISDFDGGAQIPAAQRRLFGRKGLRAGG